MMLDLLGGFGEKSRTSLAVSSGNDRIRHELRGVGHRVVANDRTGQPLVEPRQRLGGAALGVVIQITNLSAAKFC
jgi:hypothetical protein